MLGATSITIGYTKNIGNGYSQATAFTMGINTGFLIFVVAGAYKLVTTGDSSWLEKGWQIIFG